MLTMTNAVGRTWSYATTPEASVSPTPLGNTTTSSRTSSGLRGTTTYPGGATTGVGHDGRTQADESSRFPSTTDQAGRTRSFGYDAQYTDPAEGRRAQPESFEGSRLVRGNPLVGRDAWLVL